MSDLQHNIGKLDGYLARFKDTGILNQIGGEALAALSGDVFETRSPVGRSGASQLSQDAESSGRE